MEETVKRKQEDPNLSPEVKRLRYADLTFLNIFEDGDAASIDPTVGDIETVMKSLAEEITAPLTSSSRPPPQQPTGNGATQTPPPPPAASIPDFEEAGQSDLCYLLEASDDDLGLPPSALPFSGGGEAALGKLAKGNDVLAIAGMGQVRGFVDEISTYDGSLDLSGLGEHDEGIGHGGLGALFDNDDVASSWPSDLFYSSWHHDYLSAV
ncbi:hypothetical protein Taro_020501 [Colocasia esculenta]|uniref:Uncharacterized protein n=1 Tax=Colocasia esculenta TaxID=4460 RepID=A0A843V2I4_COLES|nr:hypothetical protein [Colocasia esculenta]